MRIILSNEEANLIDDITNKLKLPFAVINNVAIYDAEIASILSLKEGLGYIAEDIWNDDKDLLVSREDKNKFNTLCATIEIVPNDPFSPDELRTLEELVL